MNLVTLVDTVVRLTHTLFAGLWAGGTVMMAAAVLPAARDGRLGGDALRWLAGRFTVLTLASAVLLFVSGGHLAGTRYTFEYLGSQPRGHLILTMVGLWFVLAAVLHFGTRIVTNGLDEGREATAVAADALRWYRPAGVVAVALLVVAGML